MSLTKVTYSMIDSTWENVNDYGADPTGTNDSTAAFDAAIATGNRVYVPQGTYLVNATIGIKSVIEGAGSTATILKPFDITKACLTYTYDAVLNPTSGFWFYHSEVRNIGFRYKDTIRTGVGFTFSHTVIANYTGSNDNKPNNVKFFGCMFQGLEKGVQFPYGNIGSEFYSCGFKSNYYGVYTINDKFGGAMHNGCKYFYAGEMSGNACAFYGNNSSSGYGAISFTDTIIEGNAIGVYLFSDVASFVPPSFKNVWFEGNGTLDTASPTIIDQWVGSTRSDLSVTSKTIILDGTKGTYVFEGGVFADCEIRGTGINVTVRDCFCSILSGTGGGPIVLSDNSSYIVMENPTGPGAFPRGLNQIVTGFPEKIEVLPGGATQRTQAWYNVLPRNNIVTAANYSTEFSIPATSAVATTGSFALTGSVVNDGELYATSNELTRAGWTDGQFTSLTGTSFTTTANKYYLLTFSMKQTQGVIYAYWWNRSTIQAAGPMECGSDDRWYTFASIVQASSSGSETLFLDFGKGVAGTADLTWRISAVQCLEFDCYFDAVSYLKNQSFAQ